MAKKTTAKKPARIEDSMAGNGKKSKSALAREYQTAHPDKSTQEIADAIGMSYNAVYQALRQGMKMRKKSGPASNINTLGRQAGPSTNGQRPIDRILGVIESLGGLEQAERRVTRLRNIA